MDHSPGHGQVLRMRAQLAGARHLTYTLSSARQLGFLLYPVSYTDELTAKLGGA